MRDLETAKEKLEMSRNIGRMFPRNMVQKIDFKDSGDAVVTLTYSVNLPPADPDMRSPELVCKGTDL